MSNVKLLCTKSFSDADQEIIDSFTGLLEALVDGNVDKLNSNILDCDEFINLVGLQSKNEFIRDIESAALDFKTCEILDPTILFDDDDSASLIAKVRLTVAVKGKELRLITDSVVSHKKIDERWFVSKWDN